MIDLNHTNWSQVCHLLSLSLLLLTAFAFPVANATPVSPWIGTYDPVAQCDPTLCHCYIQTLSITQEPNEDCLVLTGIIESNSSSTLISWSSSIDIMPFPDSNTFISNSEDALYTLDPTGNIITQSSLNSSDTVCHQQSWNRHLSSPLWAGLYTVDSDICDTTQCCCPNGPITVTETSGDIIVSSSVSGLCMGQSTGVVSAIAPLGYSFSAYMNEGETVFTLAHDSQSFITSNPTQPACNIQASKGNSNTAVVAIADTHQISWWIRWSALISMLFLIPHFSF